MSAFFISLLVFIGPLRGGGQQPASPQTPDADNVYATVLPAVSILPREEFLIMQKTVPYADIAKAFPVDPNHITVKEHFDKQFRNATLEERERMFKRDSCIHVPEAERDMYISAMQDYLQKNAASMELQPTFVLPKPYRLLNDDERKQVASEGVFRVSAVGFSSDTNIAILYVGFDCMMCGRWALHVLKRVGGKWQELGSSCASMS